MSPKRIEPDVLPDEYELVELEQRAREVLRERMPHWVVDQCSEEVLDYLPVRIGIATAQDLLNLVAGIRKAKNAQAEVHALLDEIECQIATLGQRQCLIEVANALGVPDVFSVLRKAKAMLAKGEV